jgi:hypothetical protein
MSFTAESLSADGIRSYLESKKREEAAKLQAHEAEAKAERERFHQMFLEREVQPEAMDRVAGMIRKAVDMGEKQVLLFQFPSEWLPDQGRAITNHAPDWAESLDGFARRAHEFFVQNLEPRGFQMRAEIISWPNGMPGDVGIYLQWRRPEEM